MGQKQKKDLSDHLGWVVEVISQTINHTLTLFWRNVKIVARNLYKLMIVLSKLFVSFFAPGCLVGFGIEIVFFTNLSLVWKALGYLMIIAGSLILCLLLYSVFFKGEQNDENIKETEDPRIDNVLYTFAMFSMGAVFATWGVKQPTLYGDRSNIYNFKFPALQFIQENSASLLCVFVIFLFILLFLRLFFAQEISENKNK